MISAAIHPSAMVGAAVLPDGIIGKTEASATRRWVVPRTRSCSSTTSSSPGPRAHVPTACWAVTPCSRPYSTISWSRSIVSDGATSLVTRWANGSVLVNARIRRNAPINTSRSSQVLKNRGTSLGGAAGCEPVMWIDPRLVGNVG